MFNKDEEQLLEMKIKLEEVPIPANIDDYIRAGIQKGKKLKKNRSKVWVTLATAAVVFISFGSLLMSPAWNYLTDADQETNKNPAQGNIETSEERKNEIMQNIGLSDTKNGITLTVDRVMADESSMIIYYTILSNQSYHEFDMMNIQLIGENGESIVASYGTHTNVEGIKAGVPLEGTINVSMAYNETLPSNIKLQATVSAMPSNDELEKTKWEIPIKLDEEKYIGKFEEYPLNETIAVGGQNITIKDIKVYPSRTAVHIIYDKNNGKEIFGFENLNIADEKGTIYKIGGGVSSTTLNGFEVIYYFESSYFQEPKELYLQFSGIRALDKEKSEVVVNLENGTLLKSPDDKLTLLNMKKDYESVTLLFGLDEKDFKTQVLGNYYYDENGKEYLFNGYSFRQSEDSTEIEVSMPIDNIMNSKTVTIKLNDYPSIIKQDVKIRIK